MDFDEALVAIEIFKKYECGQYRDWGDDKNRKLLIGGMFEFGHEICWVTLPRADCLPDITQKERDRLERAGWFIDESAMSWAHY